MDMIDRQAAIDALEEPYGDTDYELGLRNQWSWDVEAIKALPSAEPQERKGKWRLHTYMPHKKYCSCCNADSPYNTRWGYCPNCGADMRGEQNEP